MAMLNNQRVLWNIKAMFETTNQISLHEDLTINNSLDFFMGRKCGFNTGE
jgi:hypothetical protein